MEDSAKKVNIHAGHRTRLLEKIIKYGFNGVAEHEILEAVLYICYSQANTNDVAHKLLKEFGNLHNICAAPIEALTKIKYVGDNTARYLKMLPEFIKAYQLSSFDVKKAFGSLEEIAQYCMLQYIGKDSSEVVYLLCLDAKQKLIKQSKIAEGNPGSVYLDPRRVIEEVAHTATAKVVLCHNHPGGTLFPSQKDFDVTSRVKMLLNAIGIELLDHVIVVKDKYISFRNENYRF